MGTDIKTTLASIGRLLRKYGFDGQADYVAKCNEKLSTAGGSAYRKFASFDWWGGSGSVADVYLSRKGELETTDEEKEDNRAFRSALIDIFEAMEANGVKMEAAEFAAATFRKWREQGI